MASPVTRHVEATRAVSKKMGQNFQKASPVSKALVVIAYVALPIWVLVEMLIKCIDISKLDENKTIACKVESDGDTVIDSCDDTELDGLNKRMLWGSLAMVCVWIVIALVNNLIKKKTATGERRRNLQLHGNNALLDVFESALMVWIYIWFFFIDIDGRRYLYSHCVSRIGWYKAAAWIQFGAMFSVFFAAFKNQWTRYCESFAVEGPSIQCREVDNVNDDGLIDIGAGVMARSNVKKSRVCTADKFAKAILGEIPLAFAACIIIALQLSAGENFFEMGMALVGALAPLLALLKATVETTWDFIKAKDSGKDLHLEMVEVKNKKCSTCDRVFSLEDHHNFCPDVYCNGSLKNATEFDVPTDSGFYARAPPPTPFDAVTGTPTHYEASEQYAPAYSPNSQAYYYQ